MMCAGALYWGKISRIVYGASDEKNGYQKIAQPFGPKIEIVGGVLAAECSWLIKNFFKNKR
jgi:tRNA(adenine34) deaminase